MDQEGTIAMFQYWNRLRGTRPAPQRIEIEPAAIGPYLADTFILERAPDEETRFRLAGTRICAAYGRELRHVPFRSLWHESERAEAEALTDHVFNDRRPVLVTFDATAGRGRSAAFEMLLLPLDAGPATRVIGCLMATAAPFWLGAEPIGDNRITGTVLMDFPPHAPDPQRTALDAPSMVPDGVSLESSESTSRRVRHLVVLQGGRRG